MCGRDSQVHICAGLKKFFIRSTKDGGDRTKFKCSKQQKCDITKQTRSQCQYCRLQKCLAVGMARKGDRASSSSQPPVTRSPCKVCGAESSGFHFGVDTCEGCKGWNLQGSTSEWTPVKGVESSWFHFGVDTCEGCKWNSLPGPVVMAPNVELFRAGLVACPP
ncbi:hypothetical protein Bbelb_073450 [Branchiostoma belcheri]|nr:hypothetical protein Bbelb_073450 [Branchiostoma belcheri]